jgi:sugar fermentation stimulation protein A
LGERRFGRPARTRFGDESALNELRRILPDPILRAVFVERPNRFLVRCLLDGRELVEAQMPNPGRLAELLLPGAALYLAEALSTSAPCSAAKRLSGGTGPVFGAPGRRTRFTVWAVERDGRPVFLHTQGTNAVARHFLDRSRIPGLESARVVKTEVAYGRSRFDFLMEDDRGRFPLEVKSVTLFGNGAAMFPDAVTDRGRRHLLELAELGDAAAQRGLPIPAVLFLIHSDRVDRFLPDYHTDLAFSRTLMEVRERIRILPVSVGWSRRLRPKARIRRIEIPWEFLRREATDRGAYLLLLRLDAPLRLAVGRLGDRGYKAGWYVYVGSAMTSLTARVARHLRKRKKPHWHVDALRAAAAETAALPIRSSRREECLVAAALAAILTPVSPGFGCSDCGCSTHLFHSAEKPLHRRDFHDLLEQFRMPEPR